MNRDLDSYTIRIDGRDAPTHTFLLGNRGGFVLYLPAARNVRDQSGQSIKWFGASSFGRSFFEGFQIWVELDGRCIELNRTNQTAFEMALDRATRVYQVEDREIRENYFVPDGLQGFAMTVETELTVTVKPEFDMRFYQSFNSDFSHYQAELSPQGVAISNTVNDAGSLHESLNFFAMTGPISEPVRVDMLPDDDRLVTKTYLKDEQREKLIENVYRETQSRSPDEAPIWDRYSTKVFAPALFHLDGATPFVCGFGDTTDEATGAFRQIRDNLARQIMQKRETITSMLDMSLFQTDVPDVDTAYAHVLTRFNDALVARDSILYVAPQHREHYYAIFAGDKYFMDAWKRDENISLEALLTTNDFATTRNILGNTWQFQDHRTGRLPHIIRPGEPLVYYSSDGTLWALQRLMEYTRRSGDLTLLAEKMDTVERFFAASLDFTQRGLLPSGGIIDKAYLWETWEDTQFTPRDGYPVEIELLWLTVLSDLEPYLRERNPSLAARMQTTLREGRETFRLFECDGYLVDSLSYAWEQRRILTPNGYIAFGLNFPLPDELACSMLMQGRDQLAGHRGVRSLAPRDWPAVLPAAFLSDPHNVQGKDMTSVGIFNYHRGIEWEWLNQFFVAGELRCGATEHAFHLYVKGQVEEARMETGIGGLSELHDRHGQVGADFQAWSMASFIDSLHRFAGVRVDALQRQVVISPSIPSGWPRLRTRSRVGTTSFLTEYQRPVPSMQRITVTFLDALPETYTLQIQFPVEPGERLLAGSINGESMPLDAWTFQEQCGRCAYVCPVSPVPQRVVLAIETGKDEG